MGASGWDVAVGSCCGGVAGSDWAMGNTGVEVDSSGGSVAAMAMALMSGPHADSIKVILIRVIKKERSFKFTSRLG